jgi:RHS repeat-associated protein
MSTEKETSAGNPGPGQLPAVSLPKGGGAIRGIGEKFAANPVTGSGSMTVPIATSPGRSGFGPQLSLSYDSAAGNGPFGFGWSLSLPSITRKTAKGLPQYNDAEESDVFILSGAEDLVPVLEADGLRHRDDTTIAGYTIHRYRPRVEGLFARIERWTQPNGDTHWRSISKDNILTLYGSDANSRIVDPENTSLIFSWLICESRDDKGNAVIYQYKDEDGAGVNLSNINERNRGPREDTRRGVNRYLKHIYYGNRTPLLDDAGHRPRFLVRDIDGRIANANWMFETVFDYGEHNSDTPLPNDARAWNYRSDPFSSYRSGFEVRTTRLCQRVLMFHHFAGEDNVGNDCLVRSTDFTYLDAQNPSYTFLRAVTQTGYRRNNDSYETRTLPPVEYEYTQPIVQDTVQEVDADTLENLPIGVDGSAYQWTDLHGEGIPGILTEQAGAWFYKRNLSPISEGLVEFAPLELVATKPNLGLAGGQAQFMDLAGDGQPDLVVLDGPMAGFYEHDEEESWRPFRPFTARLNRDTRDPNLKFVDLDGDGHADVLISEDDAFVWHPSLAEAGFGSARTVRQALDEENGPRLVFADGTQSIYLADLSGDGLTDLVRIRNGEICYWPNLGYGRFGAKVTMDHAPHFDNPDQFDQQRIRLADIDGSGTTDIIYLHGDGVRLYFNQSGNSWSEPRQLNVFPRVDELVSIVPTDLLGNGTACLVWSSPLPGDARRPMRYVNLMGAQKPHLLIKAVNNLGAETVVQYAPSTKFYLQDKRDGKPWITKLPFPVHVVERVETYDHISRNRFVTRYAYHHGYFDGDEREFRGFGMVEQWDTEEFSAISRGVTPPAATNLNAASHLPPVLTKTWFHTGAFLGREHISDFFAGLLNAQDQGEYYREPALTESQATALLLPDTVLPSGLTTEEEREACRSLQGMMLRQEVYALDGTDKAPHPYTVAEQNFSVHLEQPQGRNRHAVFFTHPRETITYHYERNPADPRIQHVFTLAVDEFGNTLRSIVAAYARAGVADRRPEQNEAHLTFNLDRFANRDDESGWRHIGVQVETRTYEVVKPPTATLRLAWQAMLDLTVELVPLDQNEPALAKTVPYEQWDWRQLWNPATEPGGIANTRLRLIEQVRTLYRPDDLGSAQNDPLALLPLGTLESLALAGESYKLAFTSGLLTRVYQRPLDVVQAPGSPPPENLILNAADVLGDQGPYGGGYVDLDGNANWWIPSGRIFYSPVSNDPAPQELTFARQHFFFPRRFRGPFHTDAISTESFVRYDAYDLLMMETRDAVGNVITVVTRDDDLNPATRLDYRVLQPYWVTDPNGNRTRVAFDTLGMVVGTAVMGKPGENMGDSLDGFVADLTQVEIDEFHDSADPHGVAQALLQGATTRFVYDVSRFQRTRSADPQSPATWLPPYAATLARETHRGDPPPPEGLKIQISFSYCDGFGREVQKKIQAEPEEINGIDSAPRWVGSGWTIFNNKGKPVRQYEPFFSQLPERRHRFEFDLQAGVSPILFYDPIERVVATLHPNHSWEKVVFDPWQQATYDVNDTVLNADGTTDPKQDDDVNGFFSRLADADYLPTWYEQRIARAVNDPERIAAEKAAVHRQTPTVAYLDTLGRTFLTIAFNRFRRNNALVEEEYPSRVELDIEGNQRNVRDAIVQAGDPQGRIVMRYDYDLLGNRIHQASMEAGERWILNDVTGKSIRSWDSRGFLRRLTYDELRRPTDLYVTENGAERLAERTVYGESQGDAANHRTRVHQIFDGAGVVTSVAYDFKGNLLEGRRDLLPTYQLAVNWLSNPSANDGSFSSLTTFDALNRPITATAPDGSVFRPTFNEANLLERVDVNLRGEQEDDGEPVWTPFVTNIDYNAKGQRRLIAYGSGATQDHEGATTTYDYDPLTFRLTNLRTTRPTGSNGPAQIFADPAVQDLHYTYDPAGNITRIQDASLRRIVYNSEQVDPVCEYTHDAIYRLTEAHGREHIGQTAHDFSGPQDNRRDYPFAGLAAFIAHPNDMEAMRNYTEFYEYDSVGNFTSIRHAADGGSWTRSYDYSEDSLIEVGKQSNRLTRTTIGNGLNHIERYRYDAHGNMTRMPHLGGADPGSNMHWDYRDQLREVDLGGGGTAYYVYDGGGQRVRKVIDSQNGARRNERIYLGGFEIYREYGSTGVTLERETLHIMDDKQRIAMVETRTLPTGNDPAPRQLIRYQFGNHLGSASLELDNHAQIISYEEYTPYGSTSYQAMRSVTETSKRYRYTGKERDEESGFYYHGARYYAPWLGRWTTADPIGIADGTNLYQYTRSRPVQFTDPSGTKYVDPKPTQSLPGGVGEYAAESSESDPNDAGYEPPAPRVPPGVGEMHPASRLLVTGLASIAAGIVALATGGTATALGGGFLISTGIASTSVGAITLATDDTKAARQAETPLLFTSSPMTLFMGTAGLFSGGEEGFETGTKAGALIDLTHGAYRLTSLGVRALSTYPRLTVQGAADNPLKYLWRDNPGGPRTETEAIELLSKHIEIPEEAQILFKPRSSGLIPENAWAKYGGPQKGYGDKLVYWEDFLNVRTGKIPVIFDDSLLRSDQAIINVGAHEMHELNFLKSVTFEGGKATDLATLNRLISETGTLHREAWDVGNALVKRIWGL